METITAFGDSVLKGVIYEDDHYKVAESSFQKICEESFGITVENKARFGSTITKGESILERNLNLIRVILEKKDYARYLCSDGIHPNVKGHKLIADAITAHVRRKNIEFS